MRELFYTKSKPLICDQSVVLVYEDKETNQGN